MLTAAGSTGCSGETRPSYSWAEAMPSFGSLKGQTVPCICDLGEPCCLRHVDKNAKDEGHL